MCSAAAVKANFGKVDFLLAVGLLDSDLNCADTASLLPLDATVELCVVLIPCSRGCSRKFITAQALGSY